MLAGAAITAVLRRADLDDSSRFADDFFDLKDSVTSARSFENADRHGGLYELQTQCTVKKIASLSPDAIRWQWPGRLLAAAGILVFASALTAFKSPSAGVLEQLEIEATTLARSEEVQEKLEEFVEELAKSMDEDERALVNPDKLKKWIEQLEQTKDRKEAMRQLAELERKIRKEAAMESQKRDEQLLAQAARELEKAEETKELGKKLKQQKFREAAKDLKKLAPEKRKTLSQEKKELARLKAAAQRMAAAAKAARPKKKKFQLKKKFKPSDLDQIVTDLDKGVRDYAKSLDDAELAEGQLGEIDPEKMRDAELYRLGVGDKLNKLGKKLGQLDARKNSQKKLLALSKKIGQCQSYLGKSQCESPFAGGKKAGKGSVESRRDERDELVDNEQNTALKGIKGDGPSLSKIEEAEDGTGVSNRKAESRELKVQRQFESFVQREDVPEDLKEGVKQYFKTIQNISAEQDPAAGKDDSGEKDK
ncbi:MAG: hypothetical protein O3A87_04700 [Verrucomicrobia bacterium]|nr:hypothetical protein [Verrucomicrobiota bacterium]